MSCSLQMVYLSVCVVKAQTRVGVLRSVKRLPVCTGESMRDARIKLPTRHLARCDRVLMLGGNQLSGSLPSVVSGLSSLKYVCAVSVLTL